MKKQLKNFNALLFTVLSLIFSAGFELKAQEFMRANLYILPASSSRVLVDGNYTQYDNAYSSKVDINDVWKMTNISENFGILRDGYTLVMERRKIIGVSDTTFFRLWNMQQRNYQFEIITKNCNHPGMQAFLIDAYTGISNEVNTNGTTIFNFTVTADPGSYASNRFQVVFNTVAIAALPVKFTYVSTKKKLNSTQVNWQVENETDVQSYSVERSANGRSFMALNKMNGFNNGLTQNYTYLDALPNTGDNYYRIHAIDKDGRHYYSAISKISFDNEAINVNVYPNPVADKRLKVQFNTLVAGQYRLILMNINGKEVYQQNILIASPEVKELQVPSSVAPGMYRLMITGPSGFKENKNIIIL